MIIIIIVAASAIILFYLKWLTQCSTFALSALIFISKLAIFFSRFVLQNERMRIHFSFWFVVVDVFFFVLCCAWKNVQNATNTSHLHIALFQTAIGSFREFLHANQVHSLFEISDTSTK